MLQFTQLAPPRILPPCFAITPYLLTNNKATSLARKRNHASCLTTALVLLLRHKLVDIPQKGGSQGKNLPLGTQSWGLQSCTGSCFTRHPGHWLLDPTARTPRAESFSADAELSIWDFTNAQMLLKRRGLPSLPLTEID